MLKSKLLRTLLFPVTVAGCLTLSLLLAKNGWGFDDQKANSSTPVSPAALPSSTNTSKRDLALAQKIDKLINESNLNQARWGVSVISTREGRTIYSRNGNSLFTPASNMKVYTTAAALDLIGADYRWRTSVYIDKPVENGEVRGDLTLYGRGAPDLRAAREGEAPSLDQLAEQIYQSGVRHVHGGVVGDASYFRGESYGIGWQWNDLQWYFGAEPGALTVNENSYELTIAPAAKAGGAASVVLDNNAGFVHLSNKTTTAERNAVTAIGINRGLSDNQVQVWGDFPAGSRALRAALSVYDPALYAATLFEQALIAKGVKIDGEPRSRDFRSSENERFDPQKTIEIAQVESEPLGRIVRTTNKDSDNLYAELILRMLGKERGATAPDPDPRKNATRGDDEAGTAVVKSWLNHLGIETKALAIRDGSGLSRLDLVTPEATARLLLAIASTSSAATFRDSLPIAGRDGTLAGRLKRVTEKIFAKTGTLTYDHSLSGYANAPDGEVFAFSIFCNDATGNTDPVRVIDDIASVLVAPETPQ